MKHGGAGKRRKVIKAVATNMSPVRHMARRIKRRSSPRRYARRLKSRWRHRDKRIPLMPTIGFGAGLLLSAPNGGQWSSPLQAFQAGNLPVAAQSIIKNLTGLTVPMPGTGYTTGNIGFDNMNQLLNPFDFSSAGALKGLLIGSIGSMIASKLGLNRQVKKVPFIGKYIKI